VSYSPSALSTALQGISAITYSAAANAWADAWAAYFAAAVTSNGVSFTTNPVNIALAKADMAAAMITPFASDGKNAVQAGIVAWWSRLSGSPGSYFTGASAIAAPAGLSSIASSMNASVFVPNKSETTKPPAMDRMANFLDGKNAGGTATIGGTPRTIS